MTVLAYTEPYLPAATHTERLALARHHGLELEIEHGFDFDFDPAEVAATGQPVAAVQAYRMKEAHPTSKERSLRQEAKKHLTTSMELADRLGCRRVVAICGYGQEAADQPFDRCLDFYASMEGKARDLGVLLMLEPLSPSRTPVLTDPHEMARLVATLDVPEAFALLLDTGHLADSGIELDPFFESWSHPIAELQLRGPDSLPPTPDMPVATWLGHLPEPPQVLAIEHRKPITERELEELLESLRASRVVEG